MGGWAAEALVVGEWGEWPATLSWQDPLSAHFHVFSFISTADFWIECVFCFSLAASTVGSSTFVFTHTLSVHQRHLPLLHRADLRTTPCENMLVFFTTSCTLRFWSKNHTPFLTWLEWAVLFLLSVCRVYFPYVVLPAWSGQFFFITFGGKCLFWIITCSPTSSTYFIRDSWPELAWWWGFKRLSIGQWYTLLYLCLTCIFIRGTTPELARKVGLLRTFASKWCIYYAVICAHPEPWSAMFLFYVHSRWRVKAIVFRLHCPRREKRDHVSCLQNYWLDRHSKGGIYITCHTLFGYEKCPFAHGILSLAYAAWQR